MGETTPAKVTIVYYTDPYCTWCWGSEPILRHLVESFGEQIRIVYKMGGLVEDMGRFYDPTNNISRAEQVAPHWAEASSKHGMPVAVEVWSDFKDEFRSTYPANIAYKAAELQDGELAEKYLRRLREAAAAERRPIHRREVQLELAAAVGLDVDRFAADLDTGAAEEAFRRDLHEARSQGISGFPTFIVEGDGRRIVLHGYRPYRQFVQAIEHVTGRALEERPHGGIGDFVQKYGRIATQEVAEVFGLTREQALARLEELERAGVVRKLPLGNGELWEA